MSTLVFPSSIRSALIFTRGARGRGEGVVGASSLEADPYKAQFDAWAWLPYIHDENFLDRLRELVAAHGITQIYTPHLPSHHFLSKRLDQLPAGIRLLGGGPVEEQTARVKDLRALGEQLGPRVQAYAEGKSPLSNLFLASLLSWSDQIYGECAEEKIVALCGIFASAPKGDVVEIGSSFGKSAFVLSRLAAAHRVGATLAIDPWDMEISIQHDSPADIQELADQWDWSVVFDAFRLNTMAMTAPPFNYLPVPSHVAWEQYATGLPVESAEYGCTEYTGKISVLHIDGNHDEVAVQQDFDLWTQQIVPGAWVIFDDYVWAHGNGPRVVGDAAVAAWGSRVRRHFVAGAAYFVQVD